MARIVRKRKPEPPPSSLLAAMLERHLDDLRVKNYSEYTVKNRRTHIGSSSMVPGSRRNGARGSHKAHSGALPAISFPLPAEERESADIPEPAGASGSAEGLVPVDGATAAYIEQSGVGAGAAAAGASAAENSSYSS